MFKNIFSKIKVFFGSIRERLSPQSKRVSRYIDRRPFASFFIALGILMALIIASNIIGSRKPEEQKPPVPVKSIRTYNIGKAPRLTVQAKIEKSGVITLTALSPGVIQSISVLAGQPFDKGQVLFNLSTNYEGGNIFTLQRQLAGAQLSNINSTYPTQKELIKRQREVAEENGAMAEDLREITRQSLEETKSLISLNEEIISSLDKNISQLESTNINGANDALILSTKQMKSQFLAATNAGKQGLRQAEYSYSDDNPPAELSDLQKEIALKQLDIQEKMLELNRTVSAIQFRIAQVNESLMFPTAPFSGTIQRVFVKVGQAVNPGTPLAILSQAVEEDPIIAVALVSQEIAKKVSRIEPSTIILGANKKLATYPYFVSQEPIQGQLYGVYFDIPDQFNSSVGEQQSITVDLPIGYFDTASAIPYIPVDAVYQTKEQSYIFLAKNGKAEARSIELGPVYGGYVEILKGLNEGDKVILDRNVIAGDKITVK